MELVKNVFFNTDKLIENTNIKISYTGNLFQDNSEEVFIHYGFGLNWDGLSEIKMQKTELGFQAEITLSSNEIFNFCFRNSSNVWDNNNGQNYSFNVEECEIALVPQKNGSLTSQRRLKKSYIWSKKIRLAIYKLMHYFPKLISGNYHKKQSLNNN